MAIKPGWIQTYTGKIFYPADPDPELIDICDIAAGLAKCCRWAGQCNGFYSVAQHSYHASELSTPMNALWLLMHDSAEAYLRDLPGPVKIELTDYQQLEIKVLKAISTKFELPWPMPDEVHEVDKLLLATESYYLMRQTPEMKAEFPRVYNGFEIIPWSWERAEANFLMRATKLFTQREMRK
jgi:hypothetical protein